MSENQTHDQRAAGSAQIKGTCTQRNVDAAQNGTSQNGQGKCTQTEFVHFKQLFLLQRTFFASVYRSQLGTFFVHVGFQYLRYDLHEQNNADNAERICHGMPYGDFLEHRRTFPDRFLCCGKCRRTGQCTGQQTNAHGRIHVRHQQCDQSTDTCTGSNDDRTQQNVGLGVFLQILEECRTGDQTNGSDEQDQTKALDQLEIKVDSVLCLYVSDPCGNTVVAECHTLEVANDQSHQKDGSGSQRNALDVDLAQQIAYDDDRKDKEQDHDNGGHAENMRACHFEQF